MAHYIKIPKERIPILIGSKGKIKKKIEEYTGSKININSEDGSIYISDSNDILSYLKGIDVIRAISRGFNPEKAFLIFEDENLILEIIDLSIYTSNKNELSRIKGRIIGKNGKVREIAEKLIGCKISIYGKTVSLIGHENQNEILKVMIDMLINGVNHGTVYNYLEKKHEDLSKLNMEFI